MKQLQAAAAGLMIVGMLACLAVIAHAGNEINRDVGPSAMTVAPDGRLFVVSHGKVHVFAAEDRREAALDLKAMGATRIPSDIAVSAAGRLYLADQEEARLVVCEITAARCGGRDLGLSGWTPEHLMPNNTFKFTLDEGRARIYFSDNGGNRMLITDADGRVLSRSSGARDVVHFPNQVASYAPGEITVADTNHRRLVTFDVSNDKVGRVLREFPVLAPGIARAGRDWPFGLARLPDGSHWIAVAGGGMKDADVILFDPKGKPLRRVDLGPRSDPWAMAFWNGSVVVGDARNYRLHAFAPDGTGVREFRDPEFERELREREASALAWQQYRLYAIVGVIAFPLFGIGLLRGMGVPLVAPGRQPISRPANLEAPPAPRELRWIHADREYIARAHKRQRNVLFMLIPVVIMMVLSFYMIGLDVLSTPRLWASIGAFALILVALVAVTVHSGKDLRKRLESIRLGVSPAGFHYVAPTVIQGGKVAEGGPVPWRDVYFDGRRLLARAQVIIVKTPTGEEVFERAAFEREILARIPKANFVSATWFGVLHFRAMPVAAKVLHGLGLVLVVGLLVLTVAYK